MINSVHVPYRQISEDQKTQYAQYDGQCHEKTGYTIEEPEEPPETDDGPGGPYERNVNNAVNQYMNDRDPKESIFNFKRCVVHFAVDDNEVKMCTRLCGKASWFLPFNKGNNDGAGNPPNPDGIKTDYLWKEIMTKESLSNILENYSQVVEKIDRKTNKVVGETMIFPRYHQLTVVRKLLADTLRNEVGKRYLIQHSAGSGKSNSIA